MAVLPVAAGAAHGNALAPDRESALRHQAVASTAMSPTSYFSCKRERDFHWSTTSAKPSFVGQES